MRKQRTTQRTIRHITNEDGTRIVHVPLDDKGTKHALLDELMFQELMDYGLSVRWRLKNDRKRKRVVVWNPERDQDTCVARIIANAGKGQAVVHANGDWLDLRSNNLVVGKGRGTMKWTPDLGPVD